MASALTPQYAHCHFWQVKSYAEEQEELELKVRGCYCDSQQT